MSYRETASALAQRLSRSRHRPGLRFRWRIEIRLSGKTIGIVLLLVDDRDGRIVAEVETEEEAQRVLEAWATDDGMVPDYLCLVELRSHRGAIVGIDSSVKVRPLPHDYPFR